MTFAVVGILGHFSKTLLLFFIPQIINFLYSIPQLFHFVPCPRHRLPKYNSSTNLLESSKTQFKYNELNILGRFCVRIFRLLRIIDWNETADGIVTTNNFTLINFLLIILGPQHEQRLTYLLLIVQIACTCIAFVIRYPLAKYFYEYKWKWILFCFNFYAKVVLNQIKKLHIIYAKWISDLFRSFFLKQSISKNYTKFPFSRISIFDQNAPNTYLLNIWTSCAFSFSLRLTTSKLRCFHELFRNLIGRLPT